MTRISPLMLIPPLIFAGFVALFVWGMLRGDGGLPSTRVGGQAPAITSVALEGYRGFSPEMLRTGRPVLVNFWASWCPPCRAEHPVLLQMQSDGLSIIGVNFKDNQTNAAAYLQDTQNPYSAVPFDPQGRTAIDWGVSAPPETFIIDGAGEVLFRFAGPLIGSDYEQRFLPALRAAMSGQ